MAAILVVLFHLMDIMNNYASMPILPGWFSIGTSGVDLFFVISGFIMVTITKGKFQNKTYRKKFILSRITRIYPLYWVFSTVFLTGIYIIGSNITNQIDIAYLINSFLLLPQNNLPLLALGWTLIHEMYFYGVFYLILYIKEKYLLKLLIAWICLVLGFSTVLNASNPYVLLITHPLTIEFILGSIVAKLVDIDTNLNSLLVFLCGFVSLFIGYSIFYNLHSSIPEGSMRILLFGIPSCLIVYGSVRAEYEGITYPSLSVLIGNASYSIYLCHTIVISTLYKIFFSVLHSSNIQNLIAVFFIGIFSVVAGILSFYFVETYLLAVSRRLLMNKIRE